MSHKHSVSEDPVKLVGIAAIAASIGAVIALLFTPRDGQQVRGGLKRRATRLKDEAEGLMHQKGEEAGNAIDESKDKLQAKAEEVVSKAKSTANKPQAPKPTEKPKTSRSKS